MRSVFHAHAATRSGSRFVGRLSVSSTSSLPICEEVNDPKREEMIGLHVVISR